MCYYKWQRGRENIKFILRIFNIFMLNKDNTLAYILKLEFFHLQFLIYEI